MCERRVERLFRKVIQQGVHTSWLHERQFLVLQALPRLTVGQQCRVSLSRTSWSRCGGRRLNNVEAWKTDDMEMANRDVTGVYRTDRR